jgi:hypothetical protein
MDPIWKKASVARRRMISARFFAFVPYSVGAIVLLAALGVMLPKVVALPVDGSIWYASWLISALVVGLLVSVVRTWIGRPTLADAAEEVDRRFQLRERLSSAMTLHDADRESDFASALIADAQRRAEMLDISSQFGWGLNRRLALPLIPVVASLLFFVIADRPFQPVSSDPTSLLSPTQVKSSTQPLLEQVRKRLEEAEKEDLKDAAEMYRRLQAELEKMQKQDGLDPKEALAKLNDIKHQLEQRRQELGSSESLKKNLRHLEKLDSGPADRLSDALKKGDLEKAEQALEQLLKEIQEGKLNDEQMQQLSKQIEQMEQALRQASQAHEQAKQNLQEQIRQAQQNGDMGRAGELQRKLEQLQAADSSMSQMQEMANMLSQCKSCLSQGDQQGLQEALSQMASQLNQMNCEDRQLQTLDQLMDSLSQCKSGMCEGGTGQKPSATAGMGLGEGIGQGDRPEDEDDVDFFESQVRSQMTLGQTTFGGKIGGENRKGVSRVEVQQEILNELSSEPEPLDETPLPRTQRDHTRDYFNQLREGR